jgi:hypothetical protein
MRRVSRLLALGLALSSAPGCGPQFDPSNEIKTLRVMGVKKDKPYAQPGDEVNLQLLWHDPKGRTDVQRAFIGGCINPPGDSYYGCFEQYAKLAAQGSLPLGGGDTIENDTFAIRLPEDIISSRPVSDANQTRYGLYIVFFAVCAGTLSFDPNASAAVGSEGLPIRCLDAAGAPLGSDDFVVGYTSVYSFQNGSNTNPAFTSDANGNSQFQVAGIEVDADCVGEACQATPALEFECDDQPERCIEACADDGDSGCPDIAVKPSIAQDVELDDVSSKEFGVEVSEQMWVNYYVDHGGMSEVRLVNDSTTGWNEKYRGELHAPKDPGYVQVWAVLHDNRGGMDFTRVTLKVK